MSVDVVKVVEVVVKAAQHERKQSLRKISHNPRSTTSTHRGNGKVSTAPTQISLVEVLVLDVLEVVVVNNVLVLDVLEVPVVEVPVLDVLEVVVVDKVLVLDGREVVVVDAVVDIDVVRVRATVAELVDVEVLLSVVVFDGLMLAVMIDEGVVELVDVVGNAHSALVIL